MHPPPSVRVGPVQPIGHGKWEMMSSAWETNRIPWIESWVMSIADTTAFLTRAEKVKTTGPGKDTSNLPVI